MEEEGRFVHIILYTLFKANDAGTSTKLMDEMENLGIFIIINHHHQIKLIQHLFYFILFYFVL